MLTYDFGNFEIDYDDINEFVITKFPDGTQCKVWPNDNDKKLGPELGISPIKYKLLHELAHQLVAFAYGHEVCPIVWAEAHQLPFPENSAWLEWQIMAISELALDFDKEDSEGLKPLRLKANIFIMANNLFRLLCKCPNEKINVRQFYFLNIDNMFNH